MRRVGVLLVLATSLLAQAQGADGDALFPRLESEDAAVRAAAAAELDALDDATRVRMARAAFADPDAPGAVAAALSVSTWSLDLDEQRLQARALLRAPDLHGRAYRSLSWCRDPDLQRSQARNELREPEFFDGGIPACFGAPEVPDVWRAVGARADGLGELHRMTTADNLRALLDQVADAPSAQWAPRLNVVKVVAWHTDAHRERVAALLARELRHWPDLELPRPTREGSGLPPHFETIARCAWGLEQFAVRKLVVSRVVPWAWLMRWAAEITPTAADLQFLDDVVNDADDDEEARAWALRHRVRLSGDQAVEWLTSLLGEFGPDPQSEVAAHLRLLGQPAAWDELMARDPGAAVTTPLLWRVDRATARQAAADGEFDLSVLGRARLRAMWDVDVTDADLDAVAAQLGARTDGLGALVTFYARVHPDGLRGPAAQVLAQRLRRLRSGDAWREVGGDLDELRIVLGLLEVRARDSLVALLRTWAGADTWMRELSVGALLAIREPVDADVAWRAWSEPNIHVAWDDRTVIGLHPDASIAERLRAVAVNRESRTSEAIAALARRAGLTREASFSLRLHLPEDTKTCSAVLREIAAGRPHAALSLVHQHTTELPLIVNLAPEVLRELRGHRENGLYWAATLGLALAGDPGAAGEMERALRENRTRLLDPIAWPDGARFGRRFARLHAERLGHNCCAHGQSVFALREAFPTMPVEREWSQLATQREIALAWLDAHESSVVWSAIADGWLPR